MSFAVQNNARRLAADLVADLRRVTEREPSNRGVSTWDCACPAHDDRNPSLSVSVGEQGDRVVVHCHAGCATDAVLAKLGRTTADLFVKTEQRNGHRAIVATYPYDDENGDPLFEVVRFDPKDFRPRLPGATTFGIGKTRRVLYRLPEVIAAAQAGETVYVVEGEKDADALAAVGVTATTNPFGSAKWDDDYTKALIGARVVLVADKDDGAGAEHVSKVAASLSKHNVEFMVVQAAEGKDASDHLAAGYGVDDFEPIELVPPPTNSTPRAATSTDAVETAKRLGDLLDLGSVGLSVTGAVIHGRGSKASADLLLSNGETVMFETLREFAQQTKLTVEIAATTGARPKLNQAHAIEAVTLLRQLAEHRRTFDEDDIATEWGVSYLQEADRLDLDINNQAERWAAFSQLAGIEPAMVAHATGVTLAAANVVLHHVDGTRFVRCGWFYAHARAQDVGLSQAQVAHRMERVGWNRRGSRGAIKATAPGGLAGELSWNFYMVPPGWEQRR